MKNFIDKIKDQLTCNKNSYTIYNGNKFKKNFKISDKDF